MNNKKELVRFARFAVVGAIGAVIDFGVLNLLVQVVRLDFIIASVISFVCAAISNFIWNRLWTYPESRSKRVRTQLTQFTLISVLGLLIRTPLLAWLESGLTRFFTETLTINLFTPVFWAHNTALAIAIAVVMLWNFLANRFWTYSDVQ
jgi:putative flippase GtrA